MNTKQILDKIKSHFGLNDLSEQIRVYFTLQIESIKTSIVEGSSKAVYGAIQGIVLGFLGLCIFLFGNLALGFGLSEWFFDKQYWTGFAILAGFYLLLVLIFLMVRAMIKKKVEEGVSSAVEGTPLELKTVPQIYYPNSTTRKNLEKKVDEDTKNDPKELSEAERKRLMEAEMDRNTNALEDQVNQNYTKH